MHDNPLGEALKRVHIQIEKNNGVHILHTLEITRADRELLTRMHWLEEIIKGWYMVVRPDIRAGESTAWYACFWDFIKLYLKRLYGKEYCLSAECSLDLHLGSTSIPKQLIVIAKGGSGSIAQLPHDTSLLVYSDPKRMPEEKEEVRGLQVMPLAVALCRVSSHFFSHHPKDAEIALRSISQPADLIRAILNENVKKGAARIIGAYEFLGNTQMAKALSEGLLEAGFLVKTENPFLIEQPLLSQSASNSAVANRIFALWAIYREEIIKHFPAPPGMPKNGRNYLKHVADMYAQDAYNSLSIEGYLVTKELVQKVSENQWNPDLDPNDQSIRNALAARGYFEAFQEVQKSIRKILDNALPEEVIKEDLARWFQKLFAPSARAGIIPMIDLYGYRRGQVFIRNSRHTPLAKEQLLDAMEAFFKCIEQEKHPAVRAILGHFIFVYIHPYMDGNGRLGRFVMNALFASGGYPWTIIQVESRNAYFGALEKASLQESIVPFTKFIFSQMHATSKTF